MLINFNEIQETAIEKFRDGEKMTISRMYLDEKNKIMTGRLEPGASIGLHKHETSSEVIYILRGTGKVLCDGAYESLESGLCHYCPKGHEHSLINDSNADLVFFAVVPEQ